jgi:hypothetical protein
MGLPTTFIFIKLISCIVTYQPSILSHPPSPSGQSQSHLFKLFKFLTLQKSPLPALQAPFPWSEAEYPEGIGEGLGIGLLIDNGTQKSLGCILRLPCHHPHPYPCQQSPLMLRLTTVGFASSQFVQGAIYVSYVCPWPSGC